MKAKKVLATVLCGAMLVAGSVGATLAYLTSTTEEVVNTFSVGNVKITLDEAKVTEYGVKDGDTRVTENSYKLVPGHEYVKDPIVHVDKDSENSWLFVKVVDEIAEIQAGKEDTTDAAKDTVAEQMAAKGWTVVAGETNVYAYKEIVKANDNVPVFDKFEIIGDIDNETLATYAGKTIKVMAYAVQADGFTTAAAAWEAAQSDWTEPVTPDENV